MLGTKRTFGTKTLAERVNRIAQAPSYTPPVDPNAQSGRRAERAAAWRPGTLVLLGGERLEVVVKNISATGARVEFVRSTHLPERVQLIEPLQGINRRAYVTWQDWGSAGLQFVSETR